MKHVIVIGGGVVGAAAAYQMQSKGAAVTFIDSAARRASDASFGWINASFFHNKDHFELRRKGIEAYHRLSQSLNLPIEWCGCLAWEQSGKEFDETASKLESLDYDFRVVEQAEIKRLEPAVANPPERAFFMPNEGAAETGELAETFRQAAIAVGARLVTGAHVEHVEPGTRPEVITNIGAYAADHVLIAAGTGTSRLLRQFGEMLPQRKSPAAMVFTKPVPPVLRHILVSEIGEVRQMRDGTIMLPWDINHQSGGEKELEIDPETAETEALDRLRSLLPDLSLEIARMTVAERPMPMDGLPVIGPVSDNVHVAVMHSGITLAAIAAELLSVEILDGPTNQTEAQLAPFRMRSFEKTES